MDKQIGAVRVFKNSGRDEDEATETLPPLYQGTRWSVRGIGGSYNYRFAVIGDDLLTLRQSVGVGHIEGDVPPGADYVVQWLVRGESVVDIGRDPVPQRVGRPILFPAHRRFLFSFDDYEQRLVHLNRDLVDSLALERFGIAKGTAEFDHTATPSPVARDGWQKTVAAIASVLQGGEVTALQWSDLQQRAAAAFLDLLPPRSGRAAHREAPAGDARLAQAIEFVRDNAHLPLTTQAIGDAVGVGPRAVQAAFQSSLGVTPIAFIREVRLERAHHDLLRGDPDETSVSEISARWGFAHKGRFSAVYEAHFGEQPRRTLQR